MADAQPTTQAPAQGQNQIQRVTRNETNPFVAIPCMWMQHDVVNGFIS